MFKRFQNMILTPRMWLSAGVFCFGAAAILGYHQDQMAAEGILAKKVSLPPQVLIQNFAPQQHSNILNEVQFLAEAALTQTVTLNIGTEDAAKWVQVTPVYAVGAISRPFADAYRARKEGHARRPMPRNRKTELAAEAQSIQSIEQVPMGLVLIGADYSVEQSGLLNSLGDGLNGPLISLTGSLLVSTNISQQAAATLAENGVSILNGSPIVVPYQNGMRIAEQAFDYSTARSILEWMSLAMVLMGVAQMFKLFQRPPKPAEGPFQEVAAVGAFPGVFQPIRTQEDLVREEQEKSEQEASSTRRKLSRIMHSA